MAYNQDRELTEKLEERLRWYYEEASDDEFDAEEVDAVCTLLEKINPVGDKLPDQGEAYEKLMERIKSEVPGEKPFSDKSIGYERFAAWMREDEEEEFEEENEAEVSDKSEKPRLFRKRTGRTSHKRRYRAAAIWGIGIIGAVTLSLNSYTKATANKSLFSVILDEVGSVYVDKVGKGSTGLHSDNNAVIEMYDSWSELDIAIKSEIAVPEYIPEGYSLYTIEYSNPDNRTVIRAKYYNKSGGHLLFHISLCEDQIDLYNEKLIEDEGKEFLSEYSDEDTLYYQIRDEYICLKTIKYCYYKITGNMELEEIIRVAEGLNDRKEQE